MGFNNSERGFTTAKLKTVTASGNPLNLYSAKRLRQLTIYGNAVQDGTPSPDAPVDIQLCGDRTGNLLSMIDASPNTIPVKSYSNGIIEVIGEASLSGGRTNRLSDYITLETNQTYTMVSYLVAGQTDPNLYVCLSRREDGTIYKSIEISAEKRFITIAPDENVELYLGINVTQGNRNSTLRVAIYKGSYTADTLPAYEPYGYKVSGRAEGLNLLDYTKATDRFGTPLTIINNGVSWDSYVSYYFFIPCDLKSGITVSFSCKSDYPENSDIINSFMVHYVDGSTEYQPIGFSITLKNDVDRIQIRKRRSSIVSETPIKVTDIMLVQGTYTAETMPPYEPYQPPQDFAVYLPEQLAKVGDVADEVVVDMEKQTAELKKNVCKYTFADNVSFTGPSANGNGEFYRYFFYPTPYMKNGIGMAGLCNVLPEYRGWNSGDFEHVHFGQNNEVIYLILNEEYSNDQDVVSHLSKKAEPYFIYPLAEPVTTDITSLQQWDAMPQVSGTVTLTLSAEVEPSGAEAVYRSSKRPSYENSIMLLPSFPDEDEPHDTSDDLDMIMIMDD